MVGKDQWLSPKAGFTVLGGHGGDTVSHELNTKLCCSKNVGQLRFS